MAMNLAILSRTRRACEHVFMRGKIWAEGLRSRYALPALGGLIGLLILISYVHPVKADAVFGPLTDQTGYTIFGPILGLVSGLLYLIVKLLLMLDNALADMMIQAAQYNNFVQAQPVLVGWPLVRDVCNMFFILVLLVVAFSTIIGYEKFHYKKIVPKLLLMSVLINFSKTLVGLLIDFSQVLTLTFVNGFRAAALGNFMAAFGLTDMLSVMQGAYGTGDHDPSEIIIALIFAVGMLSVVATIMLIMCIYFVVRIVMLWVLLIFSPAAFFATALPDTLKASLSSFTSEWWKKLSTMLSGGPIIAFFLWLTFAMVQNGGDNFAVTEKIYTPGSAASQAELGVTVTGAGRPEKMQTFLVAAIMLLIGLNTAVKVSTETAGQLGKVAEKIKSTGGPAGWAAKLGYRAAKGTARGVDRQLGISATVGKGLLQAGAQNPNSMFGRTAASLGAGLVGVSAKYKAGEKEKYEKATKNLSAAEKAQYFAAHAAPSELSDPYALEAAQKLEQENAMKLGRKERNAILERQAREGATAGVRSSANTSLAKFMTRGDERAAMIKDLKAANPGMSDTQAADIVRARVANQMQAAMSAMEANGDEAGMKDLGSFLQKRPDLVTNPRDLFEALDAAKGDPDHLYQHIDREALHNSDVLAGLFDEFVRTGDRAGLENNEIYKRIMKGKGSEAAVLEQWANDVASNKLTPGGTGAQTYAANVLAAMSSNDVNGWQSNRYRMDSTSAGIVYGDANSAASWTPAAPPPPPSYNSWADVTRGVSAAAIAGGAPVLIPPGITSSQADDLAKKFGREVTLDEQKHLSDTSSGRSAAAMYVSGPASGGAFSSTERTVMAQGQMAGLPASITAGYDVTSGTYASSAHELADAENMSDALMNITSTDANDQTHARSFVGNMDAKAIEKGGKMAENIIKVMSKPGNMSYLGQINQKTKGAMGKKVEAVTHAIYKSTDAINKRAEAGERFAPGSKEEQALVARRAMESDPVLGPIIGRMT